MSIKLTHSKSRDYFFVSVQVILFLAYAYPVLCFFETPYVLKVAGIVLVMAGALIIIISIILLDKNLTPFPTPKNTGQLVTIGLYHYVRHPIYSGIIFSSLGYSVYTGSWFKVLIAMFLIILFYFKTRYEEKKLTDKFIEYSAYKKRVGRFLPKLL